MIRFLIAVTAVSTLANAATCPAGFDLMAGSKCIKPLTLGVMGKLPDLFDDMEATCTADKGHLPIIMSAVENTIYNGIVASFPGITIENAYLVLGMVYNKTTGKLQWEDGSAITYKGPNTIDINTNRHVVSEVSLNTWWAVPDNAFYNFTFLCEIAPIELVLDDQCGEYEFMAVSEDETKPCIQVFKEKTGWRQAHENCKDDFGTLATIHNDAENDFIRRHATANAVVRGGLSIGARQITEEDANDWEWEDGPVPIGKKVYDNFMDAFPIEGGGGCGAMIVENTKGEWLNVDCDAPQPYVCRRLKYPSSPVKTCPDTVPIDTDFFPPGFPNSNIPCEYVLTVGAGKLVRLDIKALEANAGADYLEIYEGLSDTPIANLTGSAPNPNSYTTGTSNMMRVNWVPKGLPVVRGFQLFYTDIPI